MEGIFNIRGICLDISQAGIHRNGFAACERVRRTTWSLSVMECVICFDSFKNL